MRATKDKDEDVAVELDSRRLPSRGDHQATTLGTLQVRDEGGTRVTTQGDAYFGSQAVDGEAEGEGDDVIVRCDNIHKTYLLGVEGVPALRGVSLSIRRGEFVCIFGTSGGGKTTMLNVLGTIDKPTRGYLHICGSKVGPHTPDVELSTLRLNKLGFVFQTFNLLSALTALENVEMPMILAGRLSAAERRKRAKELLTAVGMEKRFDHVPSQMSGGEQQRVTIARSIANQPEILLLDEPTGDLDTVNTMRVMSLLTKLNQEDGITLVLVTHDIGLKYFANRILWMRDGKLQRVEVVSAEKRAEMYDNLRKDMEKFNAPVSAGRTDGTGTGRVCQHGGASSQGLRVCARRAVNDCKQKGRSACQERTGARREREEEAIGKHVEKKKRERMNLDDFEDRKRKDFIDREIENGRGRSCSIVQEMVGKAWREGVWPVVCCVREGTRKHQRQNRAVFLALSNPDTVQAVFEEEEGRGEEEGHRVEGAGGNNDDEEDEEEMTFRELPLGKRADGGGGGGACAANGQVADGGGRRGGGGAGVRGEKRRRRGATRSGGGAVRAAAGAGERWESESGSDCEWRRWRGRRRASKDIPL